LLTTNPPPLHLSHYLYTLQAYHPNQKPYRLPYNGYKTVWHSGGDAGYRSNLIRFPDEHFSIVILANLAGINPVSLSYKVADLFLKDKSTQNPVFKVDSNILKNWAGEYFDMNSQSIIKIDFKNETLLAGSIVLVPTSNNIFSTSSSTLTFSGDTLNEKLVLATKGSFTKIYHKAKKNKVSISELKEYQGDFYSNELDTKYVLSVKDSSLQIKIPRNDEIKLSPFIKDIFAGDMIIRFIRNNKNIIDGFFISTGRVRNLYFEKVLSK
jgi:hypothetical protein